jgi:hypothetical protein
MINHVTERTEWGAAVCNLGPLLVVGPYDEKFSLMLCSRPGLDPSFSVLSMSYNISVCETQNHTLQ